MEHESLVKQIYWCHCYMCDNCDITLCEPILIHIKLTVYNFNDENYQVKIQKHQQ